MCVRMTKMSVEYQSDILKTCCEPSSLPEVDNRLGRGKSSVELTIII